MMVHLGFEVGTGTPVAVPLAHTFVTGQTQLSGKTTTLQALVSRSGQRALAFVTKRGETFAGRRIKPFLPRNTGEPIHWRLVETILAAALGQRAMKYERFWLIQAAKGATDLVGVRANVERLLKRAKGRTEEAYTLIREYLDLVVPDMQALDATDVLDLAPGLNVMDISGSGPQLQALVIRAALERVNRHEHHVVVVFPEAWEFAPRGRSAPAKDEAIAMVRKGAVLGNWLLCDSQDIAGVETTVRQGASVWILGVQRELNELKRTIEMIPHGIKRPKPEDVATLGLGEFFACWGRHAVRVYVQPAWMTPDDARAVARSELDRQVAAMKAPRPRPLPDHIVVEPRGFTSGWFAAAGVEEFVARGQRAQAAANAAIAAATEGSEDVMNADQEKKLDALVDQVGRLATALDGGRGARETREAALAGTALEVRGPREYSVAESKDNEVLYQSFKSRLIAELDSDPRVIEILLQRPELRVKVERHALHVDGESLRGRLALLIHEGFLDKPKTPGDLQEELKRRGFNAPAPNISREVGELARMGFLTRQNKWVSAVEAMKRAIVEEEEPMESNSARVARGGR